MVLNAVIVKSNKRRIKEILRTGYYYSSSTDNENKSHEIRFYKNEEAAKCNYPKEINGIIYITIDTEIMEFFGKDNIPVLLKPKFYETEAEYIFSFDECIQDLHYFCSTINNQDINNSPTQTISHNIPLSNEIIIPKMYELAQLIDYEPQDISFLKNAMHCQIIHKITDGKKRKNYTNDSFATLGDALLKFILTEYLFDKGCDKGEITQEKQTVEANSKLFELCDKSGIFKYAYNDLYFSNNAPSENQVPHPSHDPYIEAIIAAIYKDKGIEYCRKWVISFFQKFDILFD